MPHVPEVQGATEVVAWFGRWPSFHDGEILELHLCRAGESRLRVHTWLLTNEVDSQGYYVQKQHAIVTFVLSDITDLELTDFSCQNVIFGLSLEPVESGFRLQLAPCYGMAGYIVASGVRVEIEPEVKPHDTDEHQRSSGHPIA
jgi:hypothetical protein